MTKAGRKPRIPGRIWDKNRRSGTKHPYSGTDLGQRPTLARRIRDERALFGDDYPGSRDLGFGWGRKHRSSAITAPVKPQAARPSRMPKGTPHMIIRMW